MKRIISVRTARAVVQHYIMKQYTLQCKKHKNSSTLASTLTSHIKYRKDND